MRGNGMRKVVFTQSFNRHFWKDGKVNHGFHLFLHASVLKFLWKLGFVPKERVLQALVSKRSFSSWFTETGTSSPCLVSTDESR
jgi:hypothetical protein